MNERRYMHQNFPYEPWPRLGFVRCVVSFAVTHAALQERYRQQRLAYREINEAQDYKKTDDTAA